MIPILTNTPPPSYHLSDLPLTVGYGNLLSPINPRPFPPEGGPRGVILCLLAGIWFRVGTRLDAPALMASTYG